MDWREKAQKAADTGYFDRINGIKPFQCNLVSPDYQVGYTNHGQWPLPPIEKAGREVLPQRGLPEKLPPLIPLDPLRRR